MLVEIKDIVVHDRGRTDFGDIIGLSESIKKNGLLHPLVVKKMEPPGWKRNEKASIIRTKYQLICGERRLRACVFAGLTSVEVTLKENVDDVTYKEMELEENIIREDLTWPEVIEMTAQLDELKRKKYGSANQSKENVGWGIKETAQTVGRSVGAVSEDIKLAKQIRANPTILKKIAHLPKHAARRVIKLEEKAKELKAKVDSHELIISADLRLGPCEELIDDVDDNSVNLLLTDPPFGVQAILDTGASGHKSMTYSITESNVSTPEVMTEVYNKLFPKLYKKLAPGAHMYIFFAHGWYCKLTRMLRDNGFIFGEVPIIWHKKRTSMIGKCKHYTPCYESILFGRKPPEDRLLKKTNS